MRDPLNPFDDVEERVQGPFDEGDKNTWLDRDGYAHRLDGPAVEFKDGRKVWALHGEPATEAKVAAYRQKLEAERERRKEAAHTEMVNNEAEQFHTGSDHKISVGPPVKFKTQPTLPKKVWG